MTSDVSPPALLAEIRHLIDGARQRVAAAVNAELTLLYWRIGRRIGAEVLRGERAEHGAEVLKKLAEALTREYGSGWGERQLRDCVRVAEAFPNEEIPPRETLQAKLHQSIEIARRRRSSREPS
jgi:DUF1016 N-terminal domain